MLSPSTVLIRSQEIIQFGGLGADSACCVEPSISLELMTEDKSKPIHQHQAGKGMMKILFPCAACKLEPGKEPETQLNSKSLGYTM